MNILGIDPGMLRLGLGAISVGESTNLIAHGMISNPRDPQVPFNKYLNSGIQQIVNDFPKFIDIVQPDIICSEIVPSGRLGANTELVFGAITTCKTIAFQFGIPWHDIAANTVKLQVTGDGKATKAKIRNSVIAQFPIVGLRHEDQKRLQKKAGEKAEGLPWDVFDALAIALAGSKIYGLQESAKEG